MSALARANRAPVGTWIQPVAATRRSAPTRARVLGAGWVTYQVNTREPGRQTAGGDVESPFRQGRPRMDDQPRMGAPDDAWHRGHRTHRSRPAARAEAGASDPERDIPARL